MYYIYCGAFIKFLFFPLHIKYIFEFKFSKNMKIKAEDDNKLISIKFKFGAYIYISYYNKVNIYICIYINLQNIKNINKIFFLFFNYY